MRKDSVLIIDDNELAREALRSFLISNCFYTHCCSGGIEALDLTKKHRYSVFLTNYSMPSLRGDELARLLRHDNPSSFIIGYSIAQKDEAFKKAGADCFVNTEDLLKKVIPLIKDKQKE